MPELLQGGGSELPHSALRGDARSRHKGTVCPSPAGDGAQRRLGAAQWALSEWAWPSAGVLGVGVAVFILHRSWFRTQMGRDALQVVPRGYVRYQREGAVHGPQGRWRWPPGVTRGWDLISHNSISYFPRTLSWTTDDLQSHVKCCGSSPVPHPCPQAPHPLPSGSYKWGVCLTGPTFAPAACTRAGCVPLGELLSIVA